MKCGMEGENYPIIKRVLPEEADGSYTIIWNYQGREVPMQVIGTPPEETDHFINLLADFLWKHRHLGKSLTEPKHSMPVEGE